MKRIIVCFNGTWNRLYAQHPTNVILTALAAMRTADDGVKQIVLYSDGVGTGQHGLVPSLDMAIGGSLGTGTYRNIQKLYRQLVMIFEPGDQIYLFGFSRGAFAARSFVGLIRNCGILRPDRIAQFPHAFHLYQQADVRPKDDVSVAFRAANSFGDACLGVQYLGVWDTVASLGFRNMATGSISRKVAFHDYRLTKYVTSARHAIAADETRRTYRPLFWDNVSTLEKATGSIGQYRQELFPGDHGSVGGGGDRVGLSHIALRWVLQGAMSQGLSFDERFLNTLRENEDVTAPLTYKSPALQRPRERAGLWLLTAPPKMTAPRKLPRRDVELNEAITKRQETMPDYSPTAILI